MENYTDMIPRQFESSGPQHLSVSPEELGSYVVRHKGLPLFSHRSESRAREFMDDYNTTLPGGRMRAMLFWVADKPSTIEVKRDPLRDHPGGASPPSTEGNQINANR